MQNKFEISREQFCEESLKRENWDTHYFNMQPAEVVDL